jgi:hypothetical protein
MIDNNIDIDKKIRIAKVILIALFLIEIIYFLISRNYINNSFLSFQKTTSDALLQLYPRNDEITFFFILVITLNIFSTFGYFKSINNPRFNKRKVTTNLYVVLIINFIIICTSYDVFSYGCIYNNKIYYKKLFSEVKEYKISSIKSVNVELGYKGAVDNYFINYIISIDNLEINLRDYDKSEYLKIIQIDRNLSSLGVKIDREKLSQEKQLKVMKWCEQYPKYKDTFKYLLQIDRIN